MDPYIWIVVASAIFAGFFALNSYSLRVYSRSKLEDSLTGAKWKKRLELLDDKLLQIQLTISLCTSLSILTIAAGMIHVIGFASLAEIFTALGITAGIVAIVVVAIPHAWANCASEEILAKTLPVILAVRYLLFPITAILMICDVPIRRLAGHGDQDEENPDELRQEIIQAAADVAAEGGVDAQEMEMIESVMEFGETDAAEIMTPRTDIFALEANCDWVTAANDIFKAGHTRVPIYSENIDNIVGIIYAKDLLEYVGSSTCPTDLTTIARKPFYVPETKPLDDLLREFKTRKVHIAVVLDEYGGTAGLVSIEDVIEEIVGEIADEYDESEQKQFTMLSNVAAEVDGRLRVDELNDLLEVELPEDEDYDTVAGFAVAELGYIPQANETFTARSVTVKILEADEKKISRLRVEKIAKPDDSE